MHKLTTYLFLLITTTLIATVACGHTALPYALAELDAWVQEQSPDWLLEYQDITETANQGRSEETLLLMEAFIQRHEDDETAFLAVGIPYLVQAGDRAIAFMQELASENPPPWTAGAVVFLEILTTCRKLETHQANELFFVRWGVQAIWYAWYRQGLRQSLFGWGLDGLEEIQEVQPDGLTLTWLKAELTRHSPDGGQWRAGEIWQEWMIGKPETQQRLARAIRKLRYSFDEKTEANTGGWSFFGINGAEGLAELDRREDLRLGAGHVNPCPGPDCSHHYQSTTLNTYIREQEERQRQQINDAQKRLAEQSREMTRRSQEQAAQQQSWMAEQDRKRTEAMQFHQQQVAGIGGVVSTTVKALSKLKPGLTKATETVLKQFGHSIDDLLRAANKPINKEGLTEAARALTKHASGQRSTGTFPKLTGGIAKQNKIAQNIVEGILKDPKATFTRLERGGLEVRGADGKGLRFNSDGKLSGFLDPRKKP